jgi:cytoskeletal protein CcmA (bactofilin family)
MSSFLKRLLSGRIERVAPEENFFISSGMEFYGDLVARSSSGRIDGRFEGQIIECRKIIVGPDALIKGNIFAEDILLYGHCEGNLYATGDVKVFDSAVMFGDIHATNLLVEKDSTFRGNVKKLKGEDMAERASREKEKIIRQGRSNVHNIYSLKARAEAETSKARKVANGAGYDEFPSDQAIGRAQMQRMETVKSSDTGRFEPSTLSGYTEPVRAESVRAESVRAESVRAESVRAEPVRAEPVRAEPVRAEPVRTEMEQESASSRELVDDVGKRWF